ncbi:hypothetical protein LJD17_21925 [Microvirga rosea]|nr:hypothetical protein [Microvirga rosea]
MDLPNVMLFQCPKERREFVHLSLEMKRVGPIGAAFSTEFEDFQARFLVDDKRSFSLPGELIKTELFFDRTPETADDFDSLLMAQEFQMRLGQRQVRVIFKVLPEFTKALPDILKAMKAPPASFLTTQEAIRDCRLYRAEAS